MGQQQPLIPPQGGQGTASLPNMPDISSMLQGITPAQLQQGMAALADPKIMAQVQQQLQNPNAGDMFNNMGAAPGAAMPNGMPADMPPGMTGDPTEMLPLSPQGMAMGVPMQAYAVPPM